MRAFGPDYVHDVRNDTVEPAVSVHAYSPPLTSMRRFELAPDGLLRATAEDRSWSAVRRARPSTRCSTGPGAGCAGSDPSQAQDAIRAGAILVDTRPQAQRRAEGAVPGALLVERNVLEWRFDPRSPARLPEATGYDAHVIIMCSEGYASSLAAASLQDLGLRNATDLIGGFVAWARAGLTGQAGVDPALVPRVRAAAAMAAGVI